jgi:hypothetical protein
VEQIGRGGLAATEHGRGGYGASVGIVMRIQARRRT